jgi:prepilin-type N-terminal cleavage/methylation domain-containing protein/prepilin-type processing-associated H-X9-DG protein
VQSGSFYVQNRHLSRGKSAWRSGTTPHAVPSAASEAGPHALPLAGTGWPAVSARALLSGRSRQAPPLGREGRLRRRGQRLHGFSLAELLVVIALLAVLAALLFPALASARERACETTCLSNLRQIARAQLLYIGDWDGQFPHWFIAAPTRPAPFGNFAFWTEYFQPYLRSQAILQEPRDYWTWTLPEAAKLSEYALGTWGRSGHGTQASPYWQWPGPPLSLASVVRPADTINVMDGWTTAGWTGVQFSRHHGGMNASFVDGHAQRITEGEFWRIDTDGSGTYWMHYAAADR